MKENVTKEINDNFEKITDWLTNKKKNLPQVFYSSVDIRESLFKYASIDTNIFPAGFNNLDQSNFESLKNECDQFIKLNFPNCKTILLLCEDHTRNTFYIENVYHLVKIIENNGYNVIVASFLNEHPTICKETGFLSLTSANNHSIDVHCLDYIRNNRSQFDIDICILNNDLSDGKYHELLDLNIPIYPHPNFGWHNRKKSTHFETLNKLTTRMINECKLNIDSWHLTTLFTTIENININNEDDRHKIADEATKLLNKIKEKYSEYNINEAPYLVLKSNNGTYGMGVISIENPSDILTLNRKKRNKLSTGKSSIPIQNLMIQEGIPSINTINQKIAEEVIYNVNGTTISGFYRSHEKKSSKDILNTTGMEFKSFQTELSKQSYVLAQLANLSAQEELTNL